MLSLLLTGCSRKEPAEISTAETEEVYAAEDEMSAPAEEDEDMVSPMGDYIDLTALSSTMVYAEVYQMMLAPKAYIGKTIKMNGTCAVYHDEATDKDYYACIIADAAGCCSQGIEFSLTDDYSCPDDYPAADSNITVTGVFETYTEGDSKYCTLRNATLN